MEVGQTIAGKYKLNRLLGRGGMASVWSATNLYTDRTIALKLLSPTVGSSQEAKSRFLLEGRVSARINHPNIIEVLDVGQTEDGSLFLVMELLEGRSLDQALRGTATPLTLGELTESLTAVARALAAAHRKGVIHRDLKPTNIFLHRGPQGQTITKVLDFGVSKLINEGSLHSLTVAGAVLGSPLYMSPEQAGGVIKLDGRTDIFAFGAVLFEALSAHRCYDGANFNALLVNIATQQPKNIDDVAPLAPEPLRALVKECLRYRPEDRIASFDLVADRLGAMRNELEASTYRLPPQDPEDSKEGHVLGRTLPEPTLRTGRPSLPGISQPPPWTSSSAPAAATTSKRRARLGDGQWPAWLAQTGRGRGLGAAAGAVTLGLLGGLLLFRKPAGAPRPNETATSPLVAGSPESRNLAGGPPLPVAQEGAASRVPVVNVDALPQAEAQGGEANQGPRHAGQDPAVAPPAPPPFPKFADALGLLSVHSKPRNCTVLVDGVTKGLTPLEDIELTEGTHDLACQQSNGVLRTTRVQVPRGGKAQHTFRLD